MRRIPPLPSEMAREKAIETAMIFSGIFELTAELEDLETRMATGCSDPEHHVTRCKLLEAIACLQERQPEITDEN